LLICCIFPKVSTLENLEVIFLRAGELYGMLNASRYNYADGCSTF